MGKTNQKYGKVTSYIDVHSHMIGQYGMGPNQGVDYNSAAKAAIEAMNKYGIEKVLILPPPFPPGHRGMFDIEKYKNILKKYPDRFRCLGGGGSLNVMIQETRHDKQVSEKQKKLFSDRALELISKGVVGFGELTAEHLCLGEHHNYQTASPDHPLLLLLADIAAEHDIPIDIHIEAIAHDMPVPSRLPSPPNPAVLKANIDAIDRFIAHNPRAKIIWDHIGWDNTGHRTAALTAKMLKKHPNLYMSFKISPRDCVPENMPIARGVGLKQEWLELLREFPDRFLIGMDMFYVPPQSKPIGPSRLEPVKRFISSLPADLAYKICQENPRKVFKLD